MFLSVGERRLAPDIFAIFRTLVDSKSEKGTKKLFVALRGAMEQMYVHFLTKILK